MEGLGKDVGYDKDIVLSVKESDKATEVKDSQSIEPRVEDNPQNLHLEAIQKALKQSLQEKFKN